METRSLAAVARSLAAGAVLMRTESKPEAGGVDTAVRPPELGASPDSDASPERSGVAVVVRVPTVWRRECAGLAFMDASPSIGLAPTVMRSSGSWSSWRTACSSASCAFRYARRIS